MNFTVAFHTGNTRKEARSWDTSYITTGWENYVFDVPPQNGIELLDYVRQRYSNETITAKQVHCSEHNKSVVWANLSEEQAREFGIFQQTDCVEVIVPPHSLNRFAQVVVSEYYRWDKTYYEVSVLPDEKAILAAWIVDGMPRQWPVALPLFREPILITTHSGYESYWETLLWNILKKLFRRG